MSSERCGLGFKRPGKNLNSPVNLLPGYNQGRLEPQNISESSSKADNQTRFQAAILDGGRFNGSRCEPVVFNKLNADHQAQASNLADESVILLNPAESGPGIFT